MNHAAWTEAREEVRSLRKSAAFVGISLILMLVVQVVAAFCFGAPLQWAEANMAASPAMRLLYYALYNAFYCVSLLLPVALPALLFRATPTTQTARVRLGALPALLLFLFGMAVCILANYLVAYWLQFVSVFGVEPFEGGYNNDAGIFSLCLNLFTYAVVPALAEELVFRGWFLGALRPFGERRALLLSAFIFGLAHGNLTQLPFAFVLGLLFGFIFLRTGRLWPCMLIHFANNAMSVALSWARENTVLSESAGISLQVAVMIGLAFAGTVAGLLLFTHPSARTLMQPLREHRHAAPQGEHRKWLWLSPITLALIFMAAETVLMEVLM